MHIPLLYLPFIPDEYEAREVDVATVLDGVREVGHAQAVLRLHRELVVAARVHA